MKHTHDHYHLTKAETTGNHTRPVA